MRRHAPIGLPALCLAMLVAASVCAAGEAQGLYEDPLGRYRFSFEGEWRVGAAADAAAAPHHFYLIKQGVVAAEVVVESRPFPAPSRLNDYVKAEVEAVEAGSDMFKVSFATGLMVSGQPAVRLIARRVAAGEGEHRRETLAAQYWFTKEGRLWSLLVLTTPAEQQRSKVVFWIEETVISSFEALEPDEVSQAIVNSRKVARVGNGLAEITLPERWTLVKIEEDGVTSEFGTGRLYLFVVRNHEYGDTLKAVAHGFIEKHASLEAPAIGLEGDCDVGGEPGYFVILDGVRDQRAFRGQLIALTRDGHAFFLYGLCEVEAWPQARAWMTAVQYTFRFVEEEEAPSSSDAGDEDPD